MYSVHPISPAAGRSLASGRHGIVPILGDRMRWAPTVLATATRPALSALLAPSHGVAYYHERMVKFRKRPSARQARRNAVFRPLFSIDRRSQILIVRNS